VRWPKAERALIRSRPRSIRPPGWTPEKQKEDAAPDSTPIGKSFNFAAASVGLCPISRCYSINDISIGFIVEFRHPKGTFRYVFTTGPKGQLASSGRTL
jgi:hypothetical protein